MSPAIQVERICQVTPPGIFIAKSRGQIGFVLLRKKRSYEAACDTGFSCNSNSEACTLRSV